MKMLHERQASKIKKYVSVKILIFVLFCREGLDSKYSFDEVLFYF